MTRPSDWTPDWEHEGIGMPEIGVEQARIDSAVAQGRGHELTYSYPEGWHLPDDLGDDR